MIRATINRDKAGRIVSFALKGHAESAEHGEDLICCAASTIAQTVIGTLDEWIGENVKYTLEDGNIFCGISPYHTFDGETAIKIEGLMDSTNIGFRQLELTYGSEYVTVSEMREDMNHD